MNLLEPFKAVAFWLQCFVSMIASCPYFYTACAFAVKPVAIIYFACGGRPLRAARHGWADELPLEPTDEGGHEKLDQERSFSEDEDGDENEDGDDYQPHQIQTTGFTAYRHVPSAAAAAASASLGPMLEEHRTRQQENQERAMAKPAVLSGMDKNRKMPQQDEQTTTAYTAPILLPQLQPAEMGELSTGREDMEQGENNGDDMICGTGRDASVAAAPRVTMATVVLQRQEKKGRLTMPQMFQRRGARWQRILFKYQTGQLLQDFPSKLCNQVLPKEVQQGEQETVEYVTAEKHASQELLLDETDEPVAHKKQKMDPWQDAVDRDELASGSTAKGFELVEISDAAAVPPVPPSSPMQLDPFEPPQICIEPVEELIQKLHALKLGDDCDGGFVSANAPVDEGCSSRMDIVLAAPPNGPYNAASSDYMQMDHHRHGSGPVSTYSSSSNNSCPPLYSTSMDDVQVDIPHDARLQIELDMTMRDIDYYDADEEQEEGDDSGYSCQFTTRFPTPDTRNYGSHCTFHSMDHIGSDSDDDADDCEMVDLSDALSMLSLVADRPPSPSQDALDRTVQAVGVRKARIRQLGMWWCRCTKTKAGDFVAKARRGLRADKTDKTNRANKTNAANEANLKMPAEKIVKSRARKTPRMPRFPWHFNYWA